MKEIPLDEIKKIQIDILNKVVHFCKKNDIKYFLCGGTLLGAVRHKGYIPWDDDVDLMMLRKDYNKFIRVFMEEGYQLFTYTNNEEYYLPFAKVSRNDTLIVEQNDLMRDLNMGINLDIFPIDILPNNKKQQICIIKKSILMRRILNLCIVPINSNRVFYKNAILLIGKKILKLLNLKKLVRRIDTLAQEFQNLTSDYCGIVIWGYGFKEIVSPSYFEDAVSLPFEGKNYDAPIGYEEYLTHVYGEYMKYPPVEKRKSHHAFKAYWREV